MTWNRTEMGDIDMDMDMDIKVKRRGAGMERDEQSQTERDGTGIVRHAYSSTNTRETDRKNLRRSKWGMEYPNAHALSSLSYRRLNGASRALSLYKSHPMSIPISPPRQTWSHSRPGILRKYYHHTDNGLHSSQILPPKFSFAYCSHA